MERGGWQRCDAGLRGGQCRDRSAPESVCDVTSCCWDAFSTDTSHLHLTYGLNNRHVFGLRWRAIWGGGCVGRDVGRGRGAGRTESFRVLAMIASMSAGCAHALPCGLPGGIKRCFPRPRGPQARHDQIDDADYGPTFLSCRADPSRSEQHFGWIRDRRGEIRATSSIYEQ